MKTIEQRTKEVINMLTEKDYCDYKTCVALKELGYPIDWFEDETCHENSINIQLYEAQKWLREEKNIDISVIIALFGYEATVREFAFQDGEYSLKIPTIYPIEGKTYEEALSDGVRASIKMLQDKQKENSHE